MLFANKTEKKVIKILLNKEFKIHIFNCYRKLNSILIEIIFCK